MDCDRLHSSSLKDYLRKENYYGNATIGELDVSFDFTMPYRYPVETVRKPSHFPEFPKPGIFTFQCIKEPPHLLASYSKFEGLFSINEVLSNIYCIDKIPGEEDRNNSQYYKMYREFFNSPEKFVKYIKPYGITTDEGLSPREKGNKSATKLYCIQGKINDHPIMFPANCCAGLIFKEQFKPIPNYRMYGSIYVFLAFDQNRYIKFYFSDNPAFNNLGYEEDSCSKDMPFSMVLKIGWLNPSDIHINPTIIDGVDYFEIKGFVFKPDYQWSFYFNQRFEDKMHKIEYIGLHHPKYMYEPTDFYPWLQLNDYNERETQTKGFPVRK